MRISTAPTHSAELEGSLVLNRPLSGIKLVLQLRRRHLPTWKNINCARATSLPRRISTAHAPAVYLEESLVLNRPGCRNWSSAAVLDQTYSRSQSQSASPCPASRRTPRSPASGPCNPNSAIKTSSIVFAIEKEKKYCFLVLFLHYFANNQYPVPVLYEQIPEGKNTGTGAVRGLAK
jgi:hypothetical protein